MAIKILTRLKSLVLILMMLVMVGCSTAPTKVDLQVLDHYRSTENYGALAVSMDPELTSSKEVNDSTRETIERFIRDAKSYARERGIKVVTTAELTPADSHIILSIDGDNLVASLRRNSRQRDQINYRRTPSSNGFSNFLGLSTTRAISLNNDPARLIDEMLLIWHPPDLQRERRIPVPEYTLKPFQKIEKGSVFQSVSDGSPPWNAGFQLWYQLQSLTPTFQWEAFPREWDSGPGMSTADFKNVRYEFRLQRLLKTNLPGSRFSPMEDVVHESKLREPKYALEQKLEFCKLYMWSVRAIFELNGSTRQTEWAGAMNLNNDKPWYARRYIASGMVYYLDNDAYFFSIASPKNPFAEKCMY